MLWELGIVGAPERVHAHAIMLPVNVTRLCKAVSAPGRSRTHVACGVVGMACAFLVRGAHSSIANNMLD